MSRSKTITISSDHHLSLADVCCVAAGARVTLDTESLKLLEKRRAEIVAHVNSQKVPAYGFTRGFGHNVDNTVEPDGLAQLQRDLVRSHSSGVGEYVEKKIVRTMMLLRAKSLLRGYSGVRPQVVAQLTALLNADITPAVPCFGSVGASGDLAPLAHVALALIGEGQVFIGSADLPTDCAAALKAAKISALVLEMKEGLGLVNGLQFSTAIGILAHEQALVLLQSACAATAISTQVLLGSDTPFSEDLHDLRPHPGCVTVATWLRQLCSDSPLRQAHRDFEIDGEVQDPYNIRCAPQILGAALELLNDASKTFEIEINSVTDNPLVLFDQQTKSHTKIISGGHFHGMPVATRIYGILQALSIISTLSNVRAARYVDQARNHGLPSDLIWPALSKLGQATSSGMMVPEYASAALTNYVWGACFPTHLLSIPTDAGQEDHVSMSAGLAVRLWQTLPRVADVLAIELAYGAQAAAIRRQLPTIPSKIQIPQDAIAKAQAQFANQIKSAVGDDFEIEVSVHKNYKIAPDKRVLSSRCEVFLEEINQVFKAVTSDRSLSAELKRLSELVAAGRFCFSCDAGDGSKLPKK